MPNSESQPSVHAPWARLYVSTMAPVSIKRLMDIYVGNLPYEADESTVSEVFGEYGQVAKVKIIVDHETGRSKGFAFVTMDDDTAGQAAIDALNGADFGGRPLKVNEARPREERPKRDFNRGGGGGFNRGGGGGFNRGGGGGFNRGGGGGFRDREGGGGQDRRRSFRDDRRTRFED